MMQIDFRLVEEYNGKAILQKPGEDNYFVAFRIRERGNTSIDVFFAGAPDIAISKETIDTAPGRSDILNWEEVRALLKTGGKLLVKIGNPGVKDGQHRTKG